jgi:hypothetical protein
VRVHRELLLLHVALPQGTLDGRPHLAPVQNDRTSVDDGPVERCE